MAFQLDSRVRRLIYAAGMAVTAALAWACGHSQPAMPTAAGPVLAQVKLRVTLTVANTQWNTGTPDDFTVTVRAGHPNFMIFPASMSQTVSIDQGVPYGISISGPEGYTETKSAGCSGQDPEAPLITCDIKEKEAPFTCDSTLWDPIYRKDRLAVLANCEIAVVTITTAELEPDGDADILGDPESGFKRLLGPGNDKQAGGKLVVEIPCQGKVTQSDAIGTCDGFRGAVITPPLQAGDKIVAAAHWVEDKNHANQRELHGARIRRLPR